MWQVRRCVSPPTATLFPVAYHVANKGIAHAAGDGADRVAVFPFGQLQALARLPGALARQGQPDLPVRDRQADVLLHGLVRPPDWHAEVLPPGRDDRLDLGRG